MNPKAREALMSSANGTWRTPPDLYARFVPPAYDVSDTHHGTFDALRDAWPEPWYCNPPYGRQIAAWTARMKGKGVALLPARVDTKWAQDLLVRASAVLFLRGRLTFVGAPASAPFPSMLVFLGTDGIKPEVLTVDGVWTFTPTRRR